MRRHRRQVVGDGALAFFIPGFAGSDHAADADAAALGLLEQTGNDADPWIPLGAGVHTGTSFVGVVREGDVRDFTALGDTINTGGRLTGSPDLARSSSAPTLPSRAASTRTASNAARFAYAGGNRASTLGL
jgi:class 3 adenylate cyclase